MNTSRMRRSTWVAAIALLGLAVAAAGLELGSGGWKGSGSFGAGVEPFETILPGPGKRVLPDYRLEITSSTLRRKAPGGLALFQTDEGSLDGQLPNGLLREVSVRSTTLAMAQQYGNDDEVSNGLMALLGGSILLILFLGLAFYVYLAVAISTIAKKTNHGNRWMAWLPILDVILMLQIAGKPLWWILLFLIPFVNLVIIVVVWMGIAKARKKPEWWGVFIIVPFVDFILPGVLAFTE
jgi:ABC-type Na+ efflux pump permease subunit